MIIDPHKAYRLLPKILLLKHKYCIHNAVLLFWDIINKLNDSTNMFHAFTLVISAQLKMLMLEIMQILFHFADLFVLSLETF